MEEKIRNLTIKEYPSYDRPMEKLVGRGKEALSEEELLAILIGSGTPSRNALELADTILRQDKLRTWILTATVEELTNFEGIGPAKACRIIAGLELGKRLNTTRSFQAISLSTPRSVFHYLSTLFQGEKQEHFVCLYLDAQNRPFRQSLISLGTLTQTLVHPREVFRGAIRSGANAILVAHNHPSGDPEPSWEDISITKRLDKVGEIVGIPLIDHMVVGEKAYVSMKERKII